MKLSIIIPTYNSEKTIKECLDSIFMQKSKEFEVIVIDGDSRDKTIEIVKRYPVKLFLVSALKGVINNEESKRIWGIHHVKGEIIGCIDSDNVLLDENWVERMLKPFEDREISFADTLYFSYRKEDKLGVRYQGLLGGDDPLAFYLGLYSRYCYLTDKWTEYPHEDEDKGDYLKCKMLDKNKVPPMGSNGFLVRADLARKFIKKTFIHSDFVYDLVNNGHNCFAKVKTGIVHNQPKFFPNKVRRIKRRLTGEVKIRYNYGLTRKDMVKTAIRVCCIIPVIYDTIKGLIKKPDSAWLFHPVACFGELYFHGYYAMKYKILRRV